MVKRQKAEAEKKAKLENPNYFVSTTRQVYNNDKWILFTSFSGHRPAQGECALMGLIGPMRGAIPTQSIDKHAPVCIRVDFQCHVQSAALK